MFDPTQPVQTRSGRPARIVSSDGRGAFPIIALITDETGEEFVHQVTHAGSATLYPGAHPLDLVPLETEELWNVYLDDFNIIGPKESMEEARDHADLENLSFTLKIVKVGDKVVRAEVVDVR